MPPRCPRPSRSTPSRLPSCSRSTRPRARPSARTPQIRPPCRPRSRKWPRSKAPLLISQSAALTKLLALASPAVKSDLAVVTPYANALLAANKAIPAADLALIQKYGAVLQGAQAGIPPATLAKLQKAGNDTPNQWQHWWWVCFIAQFVFLPFIFLLTGRWSPKKARRDEEEHEA